MKAKAKDLQLEIISGLTKPPNGVDGWDFDWLIPYYFKSLGKEPIDVDDRSIWLEDKNNKQAFESWIVDTPDVIPYLKEHVPNSIPAYCIFENPTALSAGSWLIHHSNSDFYTFDRGALWEYIAYSNLVRQLARPTSKNLDDGISLYERVYGFAFTPEHNECIRGEGIFRCPINGPKYGRNILLFQSYAAVEAYHSGDEEYQVIFPIGSEYNVHRVYNNGHFWVIYDSDSGQSLEFETIWEVIDLLSPVKSKKRKRIGR